MTIVEKVRLLNDIKKYPSKTIYYRLTNGIDYKKRYTKDEIIIDVLDLIEKQLTNETEVKENLIVKLVNIIFFIFEICDHLDIKTRDIFKLQTEKIYFLYLNNYAYQKDSNLERTLLNLKETFFINPTMNKKEANQTITNIETIKDELKTKPLQKVLKKREKRIEALEKENKTIKEELSERKKNIERLQKQINKLEEKLKEKPKEIKIPIYIEPKIEIKQELTSEQIRNMQKIILQNLDTPKTEEELYLLAKQEDDNFNIENFSKILKSIKEYLNIESNILTSNKLYQLQYPSALKSAEYYLPVNQKLEAIFFTDIHCRNINRYLRSLFYDINRYAIDNNITDAFILGDVFDLRSQDMQTKPINFIKEWETLAYQLSKEFNKLPITFHILGGNHDERSLYYGLDLLKILAENTPNINSLGYQNATIYFNPKLKNYNNIGLHHTGKCVLLQTPIKYSEQEQNKVKKYLNNYYNGKPNAFFDFFGHFHWNHIDKNQSLCFVPNFQNSTYNVKAYHTIFEFNEDQKLTGLTLIPLVLEEKLKPNEKSIYQKTLKKKNAKEL